MNFVIELPKLILYFDINKTLIFGDRAKNQPFESSVLSLVCENAWGTVNPKTKKWTLASKELSFECPKEGLVNYSQYLKMVYPKKNDIDEPDMQKRVKTNKENKIARESEMDKFVDTGKPGEQLKEVFADILNKLKVPQYVMDRVEKGEVSEFFQKLYKNGYVFIFLSLYFTMIKLQQEGRDFAIIFRSFGDDSEVVSQEFNAFCQGLHPIFDGSNPSFPKVYFDGTHGSKNYMITKDNLGLFYRYSIDLSHISFVRGVHKRLKEKPFDLLNEYKQQIESKEVEVINGGKNIYSFIQKNIFTGKYNSFIMGDDYDIWSKNCERTEYSKVLLNDPYNYQVHQFFFDDNITENNHSIVDCRNVVTEETMDRNFIKGKYILKADAIAAGIDPNYFYDRIKEAEELRKDDMRKENKRTLGIDTKKAISDLINRGMFLYETEGKGKQSLTDFFGNFIIANKSSIEKKLSLSES